MTLKQHLLLIVGGAFLVLFAALGYALFSLSASSRQTDELISHEVAVELAYTNLYASGLQTSSSLRGVVLDPQNKTGYANLEKGLEDFDAAFAKAKSLPPTQNQKIEAIDQIGAMHETRKRLIRQATALVQNDVQATISFLNKEEIPLWRQIRGVLLDQIKAAHTDTEVQRQLSSEGTRQAMLIVLIVTGIALIMAVASITLIMRRLDRSLGGDPSAVAGIAQAVAEGDLAQQIETSFAHSVLDSMREMQQRLISAVGQIRANSSRLAKASETLSTNEHGVAGRIQEQSDNLAEIAAAIEQLTTSIRVVAELSEDTSTITTASGEKARQGSQAIGSVVQEMNVIQETVDQAASVVQQLGQESDRITHIVETIREIAEQTNLLALNAAIEAARAGESGRGFAVVADEVRKLAERTTRSTMEIAEMINKVRNCVGEAADRMKAGVSTVTRGRNLAGDAGAVMQDILQSSEEVLRTVREMTHSIKEQSTVSTQIAQRVEGISMSSEDNMRAMNDALASTREVHDLAINLERSVQVFKLPG